MNDRFKFRFWDKKTQTMQKIPMVELRHRITLDKIFADDRIIFMQCTGLKDKNGKLIYESDYVRYAKNKYKVEIDKFLGISLTNILNGDTIIMDDIVLFNCEVIGNEFESNTKI